jgi:hypothetical protein
MLLWGVDGASCAVQTPATQRPIMLRAMERFIVGSSLSYAASKGRATARAQPRPLPSNGRRRALREPGNEGSVPAASVAARTRAGKSVSEQGAEGR